MAAAPRPHGGDPRPGAVRAGFVYRGSVEHVAYTPDEIVWLRYFNPLEELAGLSPLAPARLSADMGHEGLHFNRHLLRNSARPDFLLLTNHELNDTELEDFYARWEQRYQGPGNAYRPAVASAVRDVKTLGLSHRDIDFIQGLRWSLEEVSRTYGVPKLLLGDFERATYANVQASERLVWRNTVVPEVRFLEDQMNRALLPKLGYPAAACGVRPVGHRGAPGRRGQPGPARNGPAGSRRPHHQRSAPGTQPAGGAVGRQAGAGG